MATKSFASKQAERFYIQHLVILLSGFAKENSFALEHIAFTPLGPWCVDILDLLHLPYINYKLKYIC